MLETVLSLVVKHLFELGLVISALIVGAFLAKGRKTFTNLVLVIVVVAAIMYGVMHPVWITSAMAATHSTLTLSAPGASVVHTPPVHVAQARPVTPHPTPVPTMKVQSTIQHTQQQVTQASVAPVPASPNKFAGFATSVAQICGLGFLAVVAGCFLVAVGARRRRAPRRQNGGQQLVCSKCNQTGAVQHYRAGRNKTRLLCNDCAAHLRASLAA